MFYCDGYDCNGAAGNDGNGSVVVQTDCNVKAATPTRQLEISKPVADNLVGRVMAKVDMVVLVESLADKLGAKLAESIRIVTALFDAILEHL